MPAPVRSQSVSRGERTDARRAVVGSTDSGPVITATIPLPPSSNNLFANAPGRGRVKTAKYIAWRHQAGMVLNLAGQAKRIDGPYSLALRVGRPDHRRRDLGNVEKPVSDLLVALGLVRDDSDCQRIVLEWTNEHTDVFVMVVPVPAVAE